MTNLSAHYSRFRVAERLLLTGHSHQAWPDVSFEAQQQAWLDAAELVDRKWERAAEVADQVRAGFRRLMNDAEGDIALGQNTHELVVRWLSAVLPGSATSPALVTTDGEFHSIRRQLDRLAEAGVRVEKVAARPVESLVERLGAHVDDRIAAVLVSSVLFESAEIVPNLAALAQRCTRYGVPLLVDAYHHLNVVPFDIRGLGLEGAFVTGGGYKYCQLGEGNCFLRLPPGHELRPVITGWFSEFATLATARRPGELRYGEGAARLAGATYDPTSHYRAASVFAFHEQHRLTPETLRSISQHQVGLLASEFRALDLDRRVASIVEVAPEGRAGFLAIRAPGAAAMVSTLAARGVFTDARGEVLRLGPAPYLTDEQLREAIAQLGLVAHALGR